MNRYQLYTRLRHALTAAHWRGYAVHSPMMYRFIREVVLPTPRRRLPEAIIDRYGTENVATVDSVADLKAVQDKQVVILREPFRSAAEREEFEAWFVRTHAVAAHLQGLLVLFFDPKLQKQFFRIRN
ncbi:hypothetical protein [Rikenella microfusus]|uniref:Uncharacterized protein n=1 Tax=Rikenella microfusus TaxID=28139 RepID=A0A379MV13_9BACT|nr:hypothetical protein [Rikenella microfusus]SUE34697.1 Uncharacterised protein [Rikenella microfusus]HJE88633.1 hypothetical protein [Rikenella microfusus]